MIASGCAHDGRELQATRPWQTTTTRPSPPTSAPAQQIGLTGLELASPDFAPGALAPADLTCAGANRSPALEWTGVPPDAAELDLALSDQTDPESPVLLWLVTGISPTETGIDAGSLPPGAVNTLNDYGQSGWGNPCIDTFSSGRRDLQFRLYALLEPSGIETAAPGNEAWATVTAMAFDSSALLMTINATP